MPTRPLTRRIIPFSLIFVLFALAGAGAPLLVAVGTTRYVDHNTCPATGSGTLSNPYCKIQDAICNAVSGDLVSVAPGVYPEAIRMRPGVSVVSVGGPSVTTINAANQPCVDKNGIPAYCVRLSTPTRCSAVTFASGHSLSTRIEGFTITGGAGLEQTGTLNHIAGGGIYVFSSPTIINNVITSNVLVGNQRRYKGGGIYIAVGAPVITDNTITGNRAVPGPGIATAVTYGYGGGIYVAFNTSPVITNNIIQGNQAGDPNIAYSLAGGGGIEVWPGDANHPGPMIDRNLVADNVTDSLGGGISLNSLPGTEALVVVTNNVIVGNRADKNGGGLYTYFNKASIINNTITENIAFLGGGIYTGQSDVTLPVKITNNIIDGNHLSQFGNGGGIYSLDLSATFDPQIVTNDLYNNDKNNCGGEISDPTCIGQNGNISADPGFVNRPARDFHLDPNSPVLDEAGQAGAPPVDRDGLPRGQDANGVPNDPMPGDVDMGAYELQGACLPAPEVCDNLDNDCNQLVDDGLGSTTCGVGQCQRTVQNCVAGVTQTCTPGAPTAEICDGLDNNCDSLVDEGFPDSDGDLLADCIDPDDDNDSVPDASDCAPLDPGSFSFPVEVANLLVSDPNTTQLAFDQQNIGPAVRYEIVIGLLSRLRAAGFQEDFCGAAAVPSGAWTDRRADPPPDDGWFYAVRAYNGCGVGTLGSPDADAAGAGDVCPNGVVDQDADGSPSDLDCNDNDALLSPITPEVCDGLDNNCDLVADEGNPGGGVACGNSVGECVPGMTLCSGGSLTCQGGIGPSPEICDGLDNDCTGIADEGFPDTDADTLMDCVDTDDDNDMVEDAGDCAPLDAGAWGVPGEVTGVDVDPGPGGIVWDPAGIGPATIYEVAGGTIGTFGAIQFSTGICIGPAVSGPPVLDPRGDPPADQAWYYLVKPRNVCGPGTYGTAERDALPACP